MRDFLGKEVKLGDLIAVVDGHRLGKAEVTKICNKTVKALPEGYRSPNLYRPNQFMVIE